MIRQCFVPIGRISLREKYGVVESDGETAAHPCEEVPDIFVFLAERQLRPDLVEDESGGHDGAAVDHRVVRLAWNKGGL